MLKYLSLIIVAVSIFSCCKKEENSAPTKVGFYFTDKTTNPSDNSTYDLYVDNLYKGKIHCIQYTPSCGDSMLLYLTLDGKKHQIDVKNNAGEYMNAEYLQVSENKCSSGSGKNCKKVKEGGQGTSFSKKQGDECAIMCFIR